MQKFLLFIGLISVALAACNQSNESKDHSTLNISVTSDPATIDPRRVEGLNSIAIVKALFEGLMRVGSDGQITPAIAEEVTISEDQKTYTFKLRHAQWTNGDPVTAEDFVYTWKKILDPEFPSPTASLFYAIKGAKDAKEGKGSLDAVGIHIGDPRTLIVELEQPTPYFLSLISSPAYLPVNQGVSIENPKWIEGRASEVVNNGPFIIDNWQLNHILSIKKNPKYWDSENVHLEGVNFMVLEDNTAFQMYENNELDWAGSPMSILPPDALSHLDEVGELKTMPSVGTFWLRFNTTRKMLDNANMRKALAYAIDRQAIVDHITKGYQIPAMGIVPPQMGLNDAGYFNDHDKEQAVAHFEKALEELDIPLDKRATLVLAYKFTYQNSERERKIAQVIQQQLEETLPIKIELQPIESKVLFSMVRNLDYDIATGSWFADYSDPSNFLEVFKTPEVSTNRTKWGNPEYTTLLEASSKERNPDRRRDLLIKAESLLMDEMPVSPIFFFTFNYLSKPNIEGVYISDMGYIDFKEAKKMRVKDR